MIRARKMFYWIAGLYAFAAIALVGFNHFDFRKNVSRYLPDYCKNKLTNVVKLNDVQPECADNDNIQYTTHFYWPSWQFMSNNRSADVAYYFPVDIMVIVVLVSAEFLFTKPLKKRRLQSS